MFRQPPGIDIYSDPPEVLNVAPLNAGDCVSARPSAQPVLLHDDSCELRTQVIFTELLCHGSRRWTDTATPRRTIFQRYSTSYASWSPGAGPIEAYTHLIPEELVELKQAANHTLKSVVKRLLDEQKQGATTQPRL